MVETIPCRAAVIASASSRHSTENARIHKAGTRQNRMLDSSIKAAGRRQAR